MWKVKNIFMCQSYDVFSNFSSKNNYHWHECYVKFKNGYTSNILWNLMWMNLFLDFLFQYLLYVFLVSTLLFVLVTFEQFSQVVSKFNLWGKNQTLSVFRSINLYYDAMESWFPGFFFFFIALFSHHSTIASCMSLLEVKFPLKKIKLWIELYL